VARYDLVKPVDERRGVDGSDDARQTTGEPDLGEERHAAAVIAGNQRPVLQDEPPTLVPSLFGYACEQLAGFIVRERQQRQLFASVDPGDDTRRPSAEPSGPGIEQNRAQETRDRRVVGVHVPCHSIGAYDDNGIY